MISRRPPMVAAMLCASLSASVVRADAITLKKADSYQLDYDAKSGCLALRTPDGRPVLEELSCRVEIRVDNQIVTLRPTPPAPDVEPTRSEFADPLGKGTCVSLPPWSDPRGRVRVVTTTRLYDDQPFFAVSSRLEVTGSEGIRLAELTPLETTAGLNLDTDPRHVWIIENGNGLLLDFYVRRLPASRSADSNGNILFYAPRTDLGLVLGFLKHSVGRTGFRTRAESGDAPKVGLLSARCVYDPPKPLQPGQHIESEGGVYVALTRGQPLQAAERWAESVGKMSHRTRFLHTPLIKANLWSSRYDQHIDEESMHAEMEAAARKLMPYGMKTFHIDAGWEKAWGDWTPNKSFPSGMKPLADQARALGLKPSIWLAPFAANTESDLAKKHADWFLPKGALAQGLLGRNQVALDITRPEVKTWLDKLFRQSAGEWGYECFKLDFLYYSLACAPFADPTMTNQEAYRKALHVIRHAIGDDRMLYPVCVPVVSNAGYADVIRIGLDNKPIWNKARGPHDQGIRTSVRTLARRYYLNRRLWINHPDVLFTGDEKTAQRWKTKPITLDEARAWCTLVGMAGGVISLGDSIVDLEGPRLDTVRRIIPSIDASARPLDLFEHRLPELWNIKVKRDFETWNVVGAFHWGDNDQWGEPMPDEPRTIHVDFAKLGLDPSHDYVVHEFWQDRHLGLRRGGLDVTLQPHSCQVFAVRQAQTHPQLVSCNRHISQAGADVASVAWNAETLTLASTQKLVGGWPYTIAVRVPAGYSPIEPVSLATDKTDTPVEPKLARVNGDLWRLALESPRDHASLTWSIRFRRTTASGERGG
ncbi:MAG: alpha-galactosidase [Phycisphaerae bacterium]|nr:alpha-galactosidase [Phycisphaerae bacterium]